MIRLPNEEFREVIFEIQPKLRYAVSNKGRLASFTESLEADGKVLKGARADGYRILRYKIHENGVTKAKYNFIFKLVANCFLPKDSDDQTHVLHLDFTRDNDDLKNLKWATYQEMLAHSKNSPHVKKAKLKLLEHNIKSDGKKLTVTKVMLIKKMLQNPKGTTRLKMIAKQFGVSETHIRRIISGENWGHIKV